jgi:membrane protein required for colicin V production
MNYLDILIFIPLVIGAWRGFKKGFIIEFCTLLALFVGIYAGIHFSDFMSNILKNNIGMTSKYLPAIAFTVTFLGVGAMVFFGGKMLEKAIKMVALGPVNKAAGVVFGLVKMLFVLSAVLIILESYDEKSDFIPSDLKENSLLYNPVKNTALSTIPAIEESELFAHSQE